MADSAILAAGGANAPLSYRVPGAAVIRIKQIHVQYADNGAGGDWLPAVRIVNDAGHTMGTAADQGVKVTAGNDADVSFFPGVKHAAAASTATANVFARAYRDALGGAPDPVQTIPATSTRNGSFPHTLTGDATIIHWRTSVLTNDTADLLVVGTYLVWANTHWDTAAVELTTTIDDPGQTDFPHLATLPTSIATIGDAIGTAQSQDLTVCHVTVPPTSIKVRHGNLLGGSHDVQQCYFSILYIPTT